MPTRLGRWMLGTVVLASAACAAWRVTQQTPWPDAFALPGVAGAAMAVETGGSAASQPAATTRAVAPLLPVATVLSTRHGAAVHAASVLPLTDGRLRAVWFSGSREGAADVEIRTALYQPATARWSDETTALTRTELMQGLKRRVKKLGNPVLARAPDGSLHLYVVTVSLGGWAGSAITRLRSTDEGQTWREPVRLVTSPFLNISTLVKAPPVAYADGTLGLPAYHELVHKHPEWLRVSAAGQVLDRVRVPAGSGSLQPVVLLHTPQQAEMLMRHAAEDLTSPTDARITRSLSADAGQHWQRVQATHLPNPNAAIAGIVTRQGDAFLVYNDRETDRKGLALAWAPAPKPGEPARWQRLGLLDGVERSDRGPLAPLATAAYADRLQVDADPRVQAPGRQALIDAATRQLCYPTAAGERCNLEYSYPSLAQTTDGDLHLVYTWHRAAIQHVRLPKVWLDAQQALAVRPGANTP